MYKLPGTLLSRLRLRLTHFFSFLGSPSVCFHAHIITEFALPQVILSATLPLVSDQNRVSLSRWLAPQLAAITIARLLLNTGLRMVYPFAPALARGLGVPVTGIYQLVTIRNLVGFASPLFSPLSERYGRRPVIVGAVLLFSAGSGIVFIFPAYRPLGVTLSVIALAKVIYDPAIQAHVGDVVPYRQRGKAISVTELSWAGALLIGAPTVGWSISRFGWQSPFLFLGVLGLAAAVFLWRTIPDGSGRTSRRPRLHEIAATLKDHPVVWAACLYILLAMTANEILFIVYGDWMERSFGLSLTSLGVAAGVIGGAEVSGEIVVGWAVDHFGKRPVIITTGALTALLYVLIPFTSTALSPALATLFVLFLFFEITVVGGIPLMTELVPSARGVVMSMILAASALGRALGSWSGALIWRAGNFTTNGLVAAGVMVTAVLILTLFVREGSTPTSNSE